MTAWAWLVWSSLISSHIKVHPMALVHPEEVKDEATRKEID